MTGIQAVSGGGAPPPASVAHLMAALREVAAEPGATLHYPTSESASSGQGSHGVSVWWSGP